MMQKMVRRLKVYGTHRSADNKEIPELRLTGIWVEQLGFKVGDQVSITTREGLMIIQSTKEHGNS
jgi:formylmethanofuran dehydrogenase subunit D